MSGDYSQNHVGLDPDDMPFDPGESVLFPTPRAVAEGNTSCANDPGPPRSSLSAICGFCFKPGTKVELTWGCWVFCSEDRHRPGWRCAPCGRDLSRPDCATEVD